MEVRLISNAEIVVDWKGAVIGVIVASVAVGVVGTAVTVAGVGTAVCAVIVTVTVTVAAVTAALATLSTDTGVICFTPAGNGRAFMTAAIGPIGGAWLAFDAPPPSPSPAATTSPYDARSAASRADGGWRRSGRCGSALPFPSTNSATAPAYDPSATNLQSTYAKRDCQMRQYVD